MSKVVLKERVFSPTGNFLGSFSSVDLEDFDLRYEEDNLPKKGNNGGGEGKSSKVPEPKDPNKLESETEEDEGSKTKQSGSGVESADNESEGKYTKPDEWDPNSGDLDDEVWKNPNKDDNNDVGGFSGSGDSGDSGESGDDSGESGDDSGELGDSGESGESSESGELGDSGESGESGELGDSGESGESGELSDSGESGESGESSNSNSSSSSSSSSSSNSSSSSSSSSNSNSSSSLNSNSSDSSDDSFDGFGDDDEDDPSENSALNNAINKLNRSKTETEKMKEKTDSEIEKQAREDEDKMSEAEKREKANQAKDVVSNAASDAKNKKNNQDNKNDKNDKSSKNSFSDSDDFDENDLLGSLGAGEMTSLIQVNLKSAWRVRLNKLFDNALGIVTVHNPNLINKKIKDAPPGREDDDTKVIDIVALMDCSGSMGSHKFKEVISQISTMLSAKNLGSVNFHIMGWGSENVSDVTKTYRKVKGRVFEKTIMNEFNMTPWATYIGPAFEAVIKKIRKKPDAILIFTDCDLHDVGVRERNKAVDAFMTKNKKRIIWVLTSDANMEDLEKIDPYSSKAKQYVKFKKD